MKAAVYCGTRNIYKDMIPSANSLLVHSDVDKIYFLIEDDIFPYKLPSEVECINISNQTFFTPDGPNFNSSWTYMVLIRAALSKIFPQYDKILSLDCDTIINENISELWDINLDNYYLAAAKEIEKSSNNFYYLNMGVVLFNLKKIREDKKDDEIIHALNTIYYDYNEQDCISKLCQNFIYELLPDYNVCNYTNYQNAKHRKIIHYAAIKDWPSLPLVHKYRYINIQRNKQSIFGLDIIIPAYKDIKGLRKTLHSIYYEKDWNIHISVIDDCSPNSLEAIQYEFPDINFFRLSTNSGPGIARQYGIEHTNQPYILFLDCGDYLVSDFSIQEIITVIKNNTMPNLYLWRWLNEENNKFSSEDNALLHGWVYKREFLELYNISFSNLAPYSNEDIGFNRTCGMIQRHIAIYDKTQQQLFCKTPIYFYTYDKNSLTHINNKEFLYTKQIHGLTKNMQYAINIAEKNNINKEVIWEEVSVIIVRLYYDLLVAIKNNPNNAQNMWIDIRNFYLSYFKKYEQKDTTILRAIMGYHIKRLMKIGAKKINLQKFLKDLENCEIIPNNYLTFF